MAKHTKQAVDYSRGMRQSHCSICKHWEGDGKCALVAGKIDPQYWCRLFARKGQS